MIDTANSFFKTAPVLQSATFKVVLEKQTGVVEPLVKLQELQGKYYVLAKAYNKLVFGLLDQGKLILGDDHALEEKYLLQLRIFNAKEEILLERRDKGWYMREIQDESVTDPTAEECYETVDSSSPIFGKVAEESETFALLIEKGRKLSLAVPHVEGKGLYALVTRSYITYSPITGQAGYGFSRYVGIERV